MVVQNVHETTALEAAIVLPDGVEFNDFQPVAYYDSYMDCIRVLIADRSVTEERVADALTLYRTNHALPFDSIHAGFCLKGIRHLFDSMGVAAGAEITLTAVIDEIVKQNPHSAVAKILGEFPANDQMYIEWEEREAA